MVKRSFVRWLTSLVLLLTLITGRPLFVHAMAESVNVTDWTVQNVATKVEPWVLVNKDGTFRVDWSEVKPTVTVSERHSLEASMSWVNDQIRKGNLLSNGSRSVTFKETGTSAVFAQTETQADVRPGGGVTGFEVFWWGYYFYMSSTHCAWLAGALAAGAALSQLVQGVLAWFNVALPAAILQVILPIVRGLAGLGAVFFGWYARGNGLVLRFVWLAVPTGWWGQ
jgi:hypothetical protein